MSLFEARFTGPRPVKVDTWGAVLEAHDVEIRRRILVRRLNEARRRNPMALAALRAEADYGAALQTQACPRGQLVRLSGSESALVYSGAPGKRLDFMVQDLERRGFRMRPPTAVDLLRDVISAAVAIQQIRPPAARDRPSWGHGEVSASNVVVPIDGRARLINLTFAVAGVAPRDQTAIGAKSLAPELDEDTKFGTPSGDVYGLAVLLATLVLGPTAIAEADAPPATVIERTLRSGAAADTADFLAVLLAALDPDPMRRFAHAGSFRAAIGECPGLEGDAFALSAIMPALADPRRHPTLAHLTSGAQPVLLPLEAPKPREITFSGADSGEAAPTADLVAQSPLTPAAPSDEFDVPTGLAATTSRWAIEEGTEPAMEEGPTFGDFGVEESDTSTAGS